MKQQTLLFFILIGLFSCERKPEISFEKTLETAVQAVAEKVEVYFVELAKPSNTNETKIKYAKEIERHISYNKDLIQSMKEVDAELSLKEKTLTYLDLLEGVVNQSKSLFTNNPENLDKVAELNSISTSLAKSIKNQFAVFCSKHGFELGLSIYDIDKYESDLKKAIE